LDGIFEGQSLSTDGGFGNLGLNGPDR